MDAILEAEMDYRTTRNLCNTSMWHFLVFLKELMAVPKKKLFPEN